MIDRCISTSTSLAASISMRRVRRDHSRDHWDALPYSALWLGLVPLLYHNSRFEIWSPWYSYRHLSDSFSHRKGVDDGLRKPLSWVLISVLLCVCFLVMGETHIPSLLIWAVWLLTRIVDVWTWRPKFPVFKVLHRVSKDSRSVFDVSNDLPPTTLSWPLLALLTL